MYKFIEVEFGNSINPLDTYAMCILAYTIPSTEKVFTFCEKDMQRLGLDEIRSIREISEQEALSDYDMSHKEQFSILE